MNMKLSRRDRVIILIVTVVVVLGLGTWLMLKPKYEEMQSSADRLAAKETEKAQLQEKIDSLPNLKATLEEKVDIVLEEQKEFLSEKEYEDEKTKEIFPAYSENYQIDNYLKELFADHPIEITGINANMLEAEPLQEYMYEYNALAYDLKVNADLANELPEEVYYAYNNDYPRADEGIKLGHTVATVSYKCENIEDIYEAIDAVAECEKNIYLQTCEANVEVQENSDEPGFVGELVIDIYTLYPLDKNDIDKDPAVDAE